MVNQSSPESTQVFTYDGSDRLAQVQDTDNSTGAALCTTREYTYDNDSNRTKLLTYPDSGSGCSTTTADAELDYTYDSADRLTSDTAGSYAGSYDALGRTQTVPNADAQGTNSHSQDSGALTLGYYANDMIASESQGSETIDYSLDPTQNRIASIQKDGVVTTNHFADDTDSPAWTQTGSSWDRTISGPDGSFAATASANSAELELQDMNGNVVATCADTTTASGTDNYGETTEFGQVRTVNGALTPYGWSGGYQRDADDLGGFISLGYRIYDPAVGRFLSTDPVDGGNANSYIYPDDPINNQDVNGCMRSPGGGGAPPRKKQPKSWTEKVGGHHFSCRYRICTADVDNIEAAATAFFHFLVFYDSAIEANNGGLLYEGPGHYGDGRYALRYSSQSDWTVDVDAINSHGYRIWLKFHFRRVCVQGGLTCAGPPGSPPPLG